MAMCNTSSDRVTICRYWTPQAATASSTPVAGDISTASSHHSNVGAIVGAVVGGIAGAILIGAALFWFLRKHAARKSAYTLFHSHGPWLKPSCSAP